MGFVLTCQGNWRAVNHEVSGPRPAQGAKSDNLFPGGREGSEKEVNPLPSHCSGKTWPGGASSHLSKGPDRKEQN